MGGASIVRADRDTRYGRLIQKNEVSRHLDYVGSLCDIISISDFERTDVVEQFVPKMQGRAKLAEKIGHRLRDVLVTHEEARELERARRLAWVRFFVPTGRTLLLKGNFQVASCSSDGSERRVVQGCVPHSDS
jgi:hypothetical protein